MVEFTELRQMLDDALSAAKGRSDFFRGGVTITSLNALRNIPARVICILGADQSAFAACADSDDLVGASSRVGDRDRRAEVRQTVLDAVLSARTRCSSSSTGTTFGRMWWSHTLWSFRNYSMQSRRRARLRMLTRQWS
ncbi:MAG: hypothetical protein R2735_06275 [Microthrixaceae bacterium]